MPNEFTIGTHYATIPSSLKRTVTITIEETNSYDYIALINGTNVHRKTFNYNSVNNEKVTLSFKPATQADEDTLASYIPDGNITDISQLPSSLPAYLINVIPQVKVNGEVVLSGNSMRLGEELDVTMQANIPGYGILPLQTHRTVAGSYLSLNVIAQSVSAQKLKNLQTKLENTKNTLESLDETQLASLTREDILGDMMYAGTLSYFAQLQGLTEIAELSANAKVRMIASNGIFGYEPKVEYLFGIPRTISAGGIHLDIPMTFVGQSLDGIQTKTAQHIIQVGTIGSALEHQVPEQMFNSDPTNPVQAISAVKALQLANSQGQKIYQINQTNIDIVIPKLNLSSAVISEIQSEVAKGKEVTTHTSNVSVPGWSGAGYIIIDPLTGDGAYMISGGSNGGFAKIDYSTDSFEYLLVMLQEISISFGVAGAKFAVVIGGIFGMLGNLVDVLKVYADSDKEAAFAYALLYWILAHVITVLMVGLVYGLMALCERRSPIMHINCLIKPTLRI